MAVPHVPFINPNIYGPLLYDLKTKCAQWGETERIRKLGNPEPGHEMGRPATFRGASVYYPSVVHWKIYSFDIHRDWDAQRKTQEMDLRNMRLTDQGVFWALCTLSPDQRKAFTVDFDAHGRIRSSRVPKDPPMVVWANGLPWFPVLKEAYVLCGTWRNAGYLLSETVPRLNPQFSQVSREHSSSWPASADQNICRFPLCGCHLIRKTVESNFEILCLE